MKYEEIFKKALVLLGYKNTYTWQMQSHNKQVELKLREIEKFKQEISEHRDKYGDAQKKANKINMALSRLIQLVPANNSVDFLTRLYNASDYEVDNIEYHPEEILEELNS